MTEQQACTLCGAGGHTAAQCNWNDRRLTFTLESLTEALGNVLCLHELGVELIAANVFRQHPEQAEGAQGERNLFEHEKALAAYAAKTGKPLQPAGKCAVQDQYVFGWMDHSRAALAQPSPAPELERPEVVAHLNEWRDRDQGGIRVTPALSAMSEEGLQKEYGPQASVVRREPLMTVAQHDRISAAMQAERDMWMQAAGRSREEVIAYIAERTKLLEQVAQAQARVAELEKQEPIGWWAQYCETPMRRMVHWGAKFPECATDTFYPFYANPVAQAGQVPDHAAFLDWAEKVLNDEQERLSGEDYLMDSNDCIAALREAAAPAQGE